MQANRLIAFHSQALKSKHLHLSIYETKLLALGTAVKKWRSYLLGRPLMVRIDHQSLKFLLEQRITTPAQQKWLVKLLRYAFVMEYKKGSENKVANALSRSPDLPPQANSQKTWCLFLLAIPDPTWLTILRDKYSQDQSLQQLIQSI